MTTIHLTDAQRDTFAACGLIVIDGEPCRNCAHVRGDPNYATIHGSRCSEHIDSWDVPLFAPEGWRILTEPAWVCEECGADWTDGEPQCRRCGNRTRLPGGRRVVALLANCPHEHATTIVSGDPLGGDWLCPDCGADDGNPDDKVDLGRFTIPALLPVRHVLDPIDDADEVVIDRGGQAWCKGQLLPLDPLPRPGQFIAKVERVQ